MNIVFAAQQLAGLVACVVAAWAVAWPLGLAVAGVSSFGVGLYLEHAALSSAEAT